MSDLAKTEVKRNRDGLMTPEEQEELVKEWQRCKKKLEVLR